MTLRSRRILYISLILAFCIIAPMVIALAIGIRWDFNHRTIIQTGGVYARTFPPETISRLGDTVQVGSPHEFRYVVPGEYCFELSAEHFYPISTTATILPRGVARFDSVELIPRVPSVSTPTIPQDSVFVSPFHPVTILVDQQEGFSNVQVLRQGIPDLLFKISHAVTSVFWSPKESTLAVFGDNTLSLIINNELFGPLHDIDRAFFTDTPGVLRIQKERTTLLVNIFTQESTGDEKNVLYSTTRDNAQLAITAQEQLDVLTLEQNGVRQDIARISNIQQVYELPDDQLLLSSNDGLHIFSLKSNELAKIDSEVQHLTLYNNILAYTTPFELWTFNTKTYQKTFHTRFSGAITSLAFTPKGSALLLTQNKSLLAWYLTTQRQHLLTIPFSESSGVIAQRISNSQFGLYRLNEDGSTSEIYAY